VDARSGGQRRETTGVEEDRASRPADGYGGAEVRGFHRVGGPQDEHATNGSSVATWRPFFFGVVLIWIGTLGAPPLRAQTTPVMAETLTEFQKVNPTGWTSSAVCGECHQAIHAVWSRSLHASSFTNGVFQAGYARANDSFGPEKARVCLSCHAPTVRETKDFAAAQPMTAEGVSCDFCHSIKAVDLSDEKDGARLTMGTTKYGPLRHAQSPAHEIVHSELHKRSEFCALCHEYRNPNGLTVLGTYSEWKSSSYAKRGQQCQDCHMPLIPGRVVALNVKPDAPTSVNLHNISGSHDMERVRGAIKLDLVGQEWQGDRVWVSLKVTNEGSGHCFPTGLPMHRAVLEVTLRDGNAEVARREIPFEIVMLDDKGRPLKREHEVFISAVSVRSDTRLKPGEVRSIDIPFRDIAPARLTLSAALYYEYSTETLVTDENGKRFEPVKMKFLVSSREGAMKPPGR